MRVKVGKVQKDDMTENDLKHVKDVPSKEPKATQPQ